MPTTNFSEVQTPEGFPRRTSIDFSAEATWMNFSQIDAFGCLIQCYTSTSFFFPESRISQATCIYTENKQVYIFGQGNEYEKLLKNTHGCLHQSDVQFCNYLISPSCLRCANQINTQSGKLSNYL